MEKVAINIEKILKALTGLSSYLNKPSNELNKVISQASLRNKWFTKDNIRLALNTISSSYLEGEKLWAWLENYDVEIPAVPKRIGLVMAGNIPIVGFHDLLCTLVSGNIALIKLSSKDSVLLPHLTDKLIELEPELKGRIQYAEQLKNFDAVIATGSSNSARYFDYYFGKYPHIIRKNRNSVAVLAGKESGEELLELGKDIFRYFGLGCRNVSKLYVPQGFAFDDFLGALSVYQTVMEHEGYKHNYDYNRTLLLMNQTPHYASDFLMLSENKAICSPIASLYFEYYHSLDNVVAEIGNRQNEIQCVAGRNEIPNAIPFGTSQQPELADYADGIDTMEFLKDRI